ncbi:hypothetical protein Tco_0878416 [Tanacetum coccineum]|uniref:Helitron helicase-like domain-containing protein n=1 Tax=Tanacetum coccineum TaxID=301880 RepID=A0ABQ5BXU5_9ASTR
MIIFRSSPMKLTFLDSFPPGVGSGNAGFKNLNGDARQRLEVPVNMNVNVPERDTFSKNPDGPQQRSIRDVGAFGQDLGGLKRRRLCRVGDVGPSQAVPANMNVNAPERHTCSENPGGPKQRSTGDVGVFGRDLGGLKRRRLCRVGDVGPSEAMRAQLQLQNANFSLSESISQNGTPASVAQGSGYGIFQQQNQTVLLGKPSGYKSVGKCEHSCEHLGALFWYEERLKSIGKCAHIDESVTISRGPYVFKISGQLYHWIGSLCLAEGKNSSLRRDIVEGLIELLDTHNALVKLFRTAREKLADTHLPTGDMLGAIVYEPGPETDMDYDIVIEECSGHPQHVNKLHPSYMSLQFPLLFPYGEDGYSKELKLVGGIGTSDADKRLMMKAYYAYLIHDRENFYNYLSRTGGLLLEIRKSIGHFQYM